MPRRARLVRYRENHAVETAFSDFDLNSRDDWEAVIKAAGGLKIHVKVLSAKVADSNPAPATIDDEGLADARTANPFVYPDFTQESVLDP